MSSQPAHYFFQWYKIIAHIFPYKLRSISYLSILLHYSTVCWFYYLNIMLTEKVQFSPLGNTGVHRFVEGTAGLQSPDKLKAFLQTPGEGRQREWDSAESPGQEMNLAQAMWASEERMGHWDGQKRSECWFPWEGDCQAEAARLPSVHELWACGWGSTHRLPFHPLCWPDPQQPEATGERLPPTLPLEGPLLKTCLTWFSLWRRND